jgi:hypothetical protein
MVSKGELTGPQVVQGDGAGGPRILSLLARVVIYLSSSHVGNDDPTLRWFTHPGGVYVSCIQRSSDDLQMTLPRAVLLCTVGDIITVIFPLGTMHMVSSGTTALSLALSLELSHY